MSKFDDIKMPDNIDEVTKNAIRRGKTKKYQYKKIEYCRKMKKNIGRYIYI